MKAGWKLEKLGDVCDIIMGQSPDGKSYNSVGQGVPLINGPVEFSNGSFGETVRSKFTTQPTKLCKEGDLILCVRGSTTGRMNIAGFDACIGRGVAAIRAKQFQPWINYFVSSKRDEIHGKGTGATFPNVSGTMLANFELLMPQLPEQQRIVAILDEAFEAIAAARANAEHNRQNARALFESYLQSVFSQRGDGWIKKPLSKLCDIKHGFAFKSEYFTNEGGYTLLTPGNFFETGGYRDRGDKQKFYSGDIPQGFLLEAGDLLVAMTEQAAGLLGSPIIVPSQGKFLHNQRLGLVSGKPGIPWLNEFFFHVFNTQAVRQAIHESASGAKVRHTSPTKIGAVTVAFPASIEEQKAIVATLDTLTIETQRLESLYQRKIAALDELKQSLLQQAFSGHL
ncbi:restriction endonuclease subunit S [Aeromonas aquatilis]